MKFLLSLVFIALSVSAADAGQFTYTQFETSVNHIDLQACPARITAKDVFCRAAIHHDNIHVYVFEKAGDMAFVDMLTFDEESYAVAFK